MAIARTATKSDQTRERILNAAARTFRDKGFAATTVNDIARTARLRAGSIYYHFDSKEQMLEEVLMIGIVRIAEAVEKAVAALPANSSPREKIRVGIEAHLHTLLQVGNFTSASIRIFGQAPRSVQKPVLVHRRAYGDYWKQLLQEAQDAGEISKDFDLSLVRMFLFGALNWSVEWFNPRKGSLAEYAEEAFNIVFDGVGRGLDPNARAKPEYSEDEPPIG